MLGEVLNRHKRDKDTLWNRSNVCLNWNPKINGRIIWQMRQQDKQLVLDQRKHNTWRWVQVMSSIWVWPCHPKAKELWHPLWEARDTSCSWNTRGRVMRLTRSHKIWENSKKPHKSLPPLWLCKLILGRSIILGGAAAFNPHDHVYNPNKAISLSYWNWMESFLHSFVLHFIWCEEMFLWETSHDSLEV